MDWDVIERHWKQYRNDVSARWNELSDDQFDLIAGRRSHLVTQIRARYGITQHAAESQVSAWQARIVRNYVWRDAKAQVSDGSLLPAD